MTKERLKNNFVPVLKEELDAGFSDRESQLLMAPMPVDKQVETGKLMTPDSAKISSVMILLFLSTKGELNVVFTRRAKNIQHGGELSFPGGRREGDESLITTAVRETEEEIGIKRSAISVLGKLSDLYVAYSHHLITPVVGILNFVPQFIINKQEVEEAFSIPLKQLLDANNQFVEEWHLHKNASYKVPFWHVHEVPLWGATAMILNEFLTLIKKCEKNGRLYP